MSNGIKIFAPSGMFGAYSGEPILDTAMRAIAVAASKDPKAEWEKYMEEMCKEEKEA
jgi:hypothetical protein